MSIYGSNETHSADGQTRINQRSSGEWWNVFVRGEIVGGFITREIARTVIRVAKRRTS